jgi:hypothetical protein
MKIKKFITILLFPIFSFAQVNSEFIHHLVTKKLHQEHYQYLNKLNKTIPTNDTLELEWIKWALFYKDYTQFESLYFSYQNNLLIKLDTCVLLNASALVLKQKPIQINKWFSQSDIDQSSTKINQIFTLYNLSENIQNYNASEFHFISENLNYYFTEYQKYYTKKPMVAALLSTVIPGSGKLYNGRKKGFFPSFLMNTILGTFAYEAINKNGFNNAYSIFSLGIFSAFYFSNIYGSYHETKVIKQEKKEELLYNVSNHYFTPCLYK